MRNTAIIIILVFCRLFSLAQANTAFSWPDKGVWPESPRAATIREVTSPLPALLTGAAEFTVPLQTLEAEDFSLPFQFRYHSNGIRIKDDPCPWGYGWTLSPAIRISRRIIGRPDGLFTPVFDKSYLSHNECYHAMTDSVLDLSGERTRRYPDFYTDPAPDIFTVQLPGKQFAVIFQESGDGYKAVTAGCDEYKIETDSILSWFRITDLNGCIYTFDVKGEYSMSSIFRTEWFPSSIELPSGNKIKFTYIDCNSAIHNMAERTPIIYKFVCGDKNPPDCTNNVSFTHPDYNGGKHLSSVEFDGEKVSIAYAGTIEGHRCIKSFTDTIDGKEVYRATFTYADNNTMLQSIVTPEGKYSFEYDQHTFNEGSGRDWWGYYNGKEYKNGGSPKINIDLPILTHSNYHRIDYNDGADRSINAECMQARMLVKATYPTGGSARWEYEPHRFDSIGPCTNAGLNIPNFRNFTEGGGVRVKSISLYENANDETPEITEFYYGENRDGKAICKAAPTPDTFVDAYYYIDLCIAGRPGSHQEGPFYRGTWIVSIANESNYMQYRIGDTPVWYSCVETVNKEGKTVTRFDDVLDSEDRYFIATDFTNWITVASHVFSEGPQITSRTVYRCDSSDEYSPVLSEKMGYETTEGFACNGHHIKRLKQSSTQILSSPDFTGTGMIKFPPEEAYIIEDYPNYEIPDLVAGRPLTLDTSKDDFYRRELFTIHTLREQLVSKTVTEYRENGSYTTSRTLEYVPGTGIINKVTDTVLPDSSDTAGGGAASVVRAFTYADIEAGGMVADMANANIIGVALKQTERYNTAQMSVRAQIWRYGNNIFRPERVYKSRSTDTADEYYSADFVWNSRGKLLSMTDRAGTATTYTWDSHSRYPIAMKLGELESRAEWKPGFGVEALTTPAGIRSTYEYDAAGRLVKSSLDGLGIQKTWQYVISQTGNNYITEQTWRKAGLTMTVNYNRCNYDGLGRPVSEVTAWQSGGWHYIASAIDYDTMGRSYRKWNPAPVSSGNADIEEIRNSASDFYGDSRPFAQTDYEASQRRMPTGMQMAGDVWHNGNHKSTVRRLVNDNGSYACPYYSLGSGMKLLCNGNYAKGILAVEETVDEDGITDAVFTDFRGQCVMRHHGSVRTCYVYNDYGDLCYILPPDMPERSYNPDDTVLLEHAYIYRYDSRGRLVFSKTPGCDAAEFIYDNADRLVAETNADLGEKWRLHFYDNTGREVLVTEATLQADASQKATLAQPRSVARGNSAAGLKGYITDFNFPADNRVALAFYYDDYTLTPKIDNDGSVYINKPYGLLTGSWAASDDNGKGVNRIIWYDRYGRKGYEILDTDPYRLYRATRHTYSGQISAEYELVYDMSTSVWKHWKVNRSYGYDNAGRLEYETATRDSCTVLTRYTYDGAGRLAHIEKGPGKADAGTSSYSFLSSLNVTRDYSYDVHGWTEKIVTSLPRMVQTGIIHSTDISRPYYGDAAMEQTSHTVELPPYEKYTETIHYADGAVPRYNGTPSARGLTQGGRYDYLYDGLDRLVAAQYTAPDKTPEADFSTEYTYDILSRPTSIKRRGVVDIDGSTEVFGWLDNLSLVYDGATLCRVNSNITDETGRQFYGRTGWANGTYMKSAVLEFNAAGHLTKDSGRMLQSVAYNTMGHPVSYCQGTVPTAGTPRQERAYDATGYKLRQTDYGPVHGVFGKTADRRYLDLYTFNADTLDRIDFAGGYFDGCGKAHFIFTDWQGNVTITTDADGRLEQHIGYYPYGEPWREPSGQHATLFAGKERVGGLPQGDYDFGPRGYRSTLLLWDSPDSENTAYPWWSPWMYCGANPIANIDPTGNEINMAPLWLTSDYGYSTVQSVIDDLSIQTGLQLNLDEEKNLRYAKNNDGKPIIGKTTDKKGKEINSGSKTARKFIIDMIEDKSEVKVFYAKSSRGNGNKLGLNPDQINDMIHGAVGVDGNTLGFGMTFMHELLHTSIGNGYYDTTADFGTGHVVDFMNQIRKELNEQGFNYGQRMNYTEIMTKEGKITPFNSKALIRLKNGLRMTKKCFYIKTK